MPGIPILDQALPQQIFVFLLLFARMLVAPSLPRAPRSIEDRLGPR